MTKKGFEPSEAQGGTESESKKRKSTIEEIEVDLNAPEPPSKKARRALKKGKQLPSKADSKDDGSKRKLQAKEEDEGDKDEKKASKRSEHCVWIGNLPFMVSKDELRTFLVDNSGGSITAESITRIHMPGPDASAPAPKKVARGAKAAVHNRGFAYVDFDSAQAAVAAMALSETPLGTRNLLIKDGKSFEGRPKKDDGAAATNGTKWPGGKTAAADSAKASRKIFVGNLAFAIDEDVLWEHFSKCGEIDWVKVATFEDSGKCKGYGWVKFKEAAAAAWAVKGFVKIKEPVETEEDFIDEDAGGSDDDGKENENEESEEEEKKKKKPAQKKFKTRKWWVNRLYGRMLKIELAEDDQVRYKKRFGKSSKKRSQDKTPTSKSDAAADGAPETQPAVVEVS